MLQGTTSTIEHIKTIMTTSGHVYRFYHQTFEYSYIPDTFWYGWCVKLLVLGLLFALLAHAFKD